MPILDPAPQLVYVENEALAAIAIDTMAAEATAVELGLLGYEAVRDRCCRVLRQHGYHTFAAYATDYPEVAAAGIFSFGALFIDLTMRMQPH